MDSTAERETEAERESQRISMRMHLEVLSSFDIITTTSTGDRKCVSESVNSHFKTEREEEAERKRKRQTE